MKRRLGITVRQSYILTKGNRRKRLRKLKLLKPPEQKPLITRHRL
jgi:hypothetical protein